MADSDLKEVKPDYLSLLDLVHRHRLATLGKKGLIRVPKKEMWEVASPGHIGRMLDSLVENEVLGVIETKGKQHAYAEEKDAVVLNCRMSAEEMLEYKHSLIIEGSRGIRLDSHGRSYYELHRNGSSLPPVRLSEHEGPILDYLMRRPDVFTEREELAALFRVDIVQLSGYLNAIRRKIRALGFSKAEAARMLPLYKRGVVVFHLF